MSQPNSQRSNTDPIRYNWEVRNHDTFQVEISEDGDDLVYHFWPPGTKRDFEETFSSDLQASFLHAFRRQPVDEKGFPKVDVRADYFARADLEVALQQGGAIPVKSFMKDQEPIALATYRVQVVGWAKNPMCDLLLKDELLSHLDHLVKSHVPEEDHQPERAPSPPERNHRRRRLDRRRNARRHDLDR